MGVMGRGRVSAGRMQHTSCNHQRPETCTSISCPTSALRGDRLAAPAIGCRTRGRKLCPGGTSHLHEKAGFLAQAAQLLILQQPLVRVHSGQLQVGLLALQQGVAGWPGSFCTNGRWLERRKACVSLGCGQGEWEMMCGWPLPILPAAYLPPGFHLLHQLLHKGHVLGLVDQHLGALPGRAVHGRQLGISCGNCGAPQQVLQWASRRSTAP